MGILDRLKPQPRWKHSDPAVRLQAIAELADPVELASLAEHDLDAKVRRAAVEKVSDPVVLGRVTASDADPGVQAAAADRMLGVALNGATHEATTAARLVSDARRLSLIAKSGAADAVREIALAKLTDERALGGVARHAEVEGTALAAAARLVSADELLSTALNAEHRDVALAALTRVVGGEPTPESDVSLLETIAARAQQKAVARRARAMLQAIQDAKHARRVAEEDLRRQEASLCAAVEGLVDLTDPDRMAENLARISAAWDALADPDAAAVERFAAGADAVRARITERRREVDAALDQARRRSEALESREALCRRVQTIEGADMLARLASLEAEWARLAPAVGYESEADQLAAQFAESARTCRARHAVGTALEEARAALDALVVEAEGLLAQEQGAAVGRWRALAREARAHVAILNGASRPVADLTDRLAAVSRAFEARAAAARAAAAQAKLSRLSKLRRLAERGRRTVASATVTLRDGERLLRDLTTALAEVGTGETARETGETIAALRTLREQVASRVTELRDMDAWRRFANAQQQEELIAMAEAIVASLKAEEEAGTDGDVAATAHALRALHLRWREVADAPQRTALPLWERFKAATDFIRSRCESHFAELRQERSANLAAKAALVAQAEALADSTEWAKTAARFQELQKAWEGTGPVPRQAARDLTRRFRAACTTFFTRRRDALAVKKQAWNENLARKETLCERAEELSASTDWETVASELKRLQADWKTIGPVSHGKREVVWERFRSAADKFFERYHGRHAIAAAAKLAEHAAQVAALEGLIALEEAPADLAAQVQTLRTAFSHASQVGGAEMTALHERWRVALATLIGRWPAAFAGTDLDPVEIHGRMEKLIAKVENLAREETPAAASNTSATELLAERLRSALANNAMGVRSDEAKWRAAGTAVAEARDAWRRIAQVPGEDTRALEARFEAACLRVMDQVRRHVRGPTSGPAGRLGDGGSEGRPGRGRHGRGRGSNRATPSA